MDGNVVKRVQNDNPLEYKDVEVWAAKVMEKYAAADAQIRNLETVDNGKSG